MIPTDCPSFEGCGAPLCPIDPDLKVRVWYIDEPICNANAQGGKRRWIRKQRLIARRKYKKYLNCPVTYQELFDISRPRELSDEQREALKLQLATIRSIYSQANPTELDSARVGHGCGV
jgi:hypothetical protein